MVSFFGIIAFVAASYGLYAQIHKKEIAQAVAAYIVTVLTIIIAVVSFQNSPNTTLVEQEDIAKESAKPTSTSTIQPVDSEDDGESEKKLNTKETNETETMSFTGNKISGIMDGEDSREEQYMATQTGIYRFDFDIDDVNNEYDFKIFDEKREEIVNTYSSNEGKTVELQKGKKYEIQIGQNTGFAKYAIQIHIPNKVYTINNNVISGSISYIDQQNVYYYTPKRTGTYGFSFGINNAENSYRISLFDSKNEVIFDTYSSNECKEVELKKNQKYRLHVNYSRGFEKYKISIKQI